MEITLELFESKYNEFRLDLFNCYKELKEFEDKNKECTDYDNPLYTNGWYTWKDEQKRQISKKFGNANFKKCFIECYVKCDFEGCETYLSLLSQ